MKIEFVVWGDPTPQGSKNAFVNPKTGRAVVVEAAGARLKTWRRLVTDAGRKAMNALNGVVEPEIPVKVTLEFYMPIPRTVKVGVWHAKKPDLDKLIRAVLDACTEAGIWKDDSRVACLVVTKKYAEYPGVSVTVESLV